jgi:hypothetical protein
MTEAGELIDQVAAYFDDRELKYEVEGDRLFAAFESGENTYRLAFRGDDDRGELMLRALIPILVPSERRVETLELVALLNLTVPAGRVIFDADRGDVEYRRTTFTGSEALAPEVLDWTLELTLEMVQLTTATAASLILDGMPVHAALEAVERSSDESG